MLEQQLLDPAHLAADRGSGLRVKGDDVAVSMVGELVPLVPHAGEHGGPVDNAAAAVDAGHKKGGVRAARLQAVQQPRGIGGGPVVKGKRDQLCPRIRAHCRRFRPLPQRRSILGKRDHQQRHCQQQRVQSFFHGILLPFGGMPCLHCMRFARARQSAPRGESWGDCGGGMKKRGRDCSRPCLNYLISYTNSAFSPFPPGKLTTNSNGFSVSLCNSMGTSK